MLNLFVTLNEVDMKHLKPEKSQMTAMYTDFLKLSPYIKKIHKKDVDFYCKTSFFF